MSEERDFGKQELIRLLQKLYRLRDEGKDVKALIWAIEDKLMGKIREDLDEMKKEG